MRYGASRKGQQWILHRSPLDRPRDGLCAGAGLNARRRMNEWPDRRFYQRRIRPKLKKYQFAPLRTTTEIAA